MTINLTDVTFHYDNQQGLNHFSLTIKAGECLVLCGQSGCGKTTITRLINGLIPELFEGTVTGEVNVKQHNTKDTPIYVLSEIVGSVFQNPKTQFFTIDVESELAFACENMGVPKEEILARMAEVVDLFGIRHLLHRKMFDLSGGEKQLVAIASAYMIQPDILVLDEPSSNLDLMTIETIKHLLLAIKARGCTLVIAEHRLYYLKELADRFVLIADGQIHTTYSANEFATLSESTLQELGLRTLAIDSLTTQPPTVTIDQPPQTLTLENVSVRYPKATTNALDIHQLTVMSGEVIGILGKNGAGKSTFARALSGLQKKTVGNFTLNQSTDLNRDKRLKMSYLVMQDVNYQLFCETVEKELLLKAGKPELYNSVVSAFQLEKLLNRHPMSLSGGQKQRVAVATAVLSGKQLIILDEPTSGLDYYHMQQVSRMIATLRQLNIFIFIISHDLEFIQSTCTQLVTIDHGKIRKAFTLNHTTTRDLMAIFNELSQSPKQTR